MLHPSESEISLHPVPDAMGQFDENLWKGQSLSHGFGKRLSQGDIRNSFHGRRREEIPPLQIGCLGQDEISIEVALIQKGIDGNMERNASLVLKDV
jgi:hypothetical protein